MQSNKSSVRWLSPALLAALGAVIVLNVTAIGVSARGESEGFKLEYVANGVWHCSDSGELSCDEESSHVWVEEN